MTNDQKMQDIDRKIMEEFNVFNNSVYEGLVFKGAIELYKKAVFASVPFALQQMPLDIKAITEKEEDALTNAEVAKMCNAINHAPSDKVFGSFERYIKGMQQVGNLSVDYGMKLKKVQAELSEKKKTLMNLSGVSLNQNRILTN